MPISEDVFSVLKKEENGIDYYGVLNNVVDLGYDKNNVKPRMSAVLGNNSQNGNIIKIGVSKEVYIKWMGCEPLHKSPRKGIYNIYFHLDFSDNANKLKQMYATFIEETEAKAGISDLLKKHRIDADALEVLRKIGLRKSVLTEIVGSNYKEFEEEMNATLAETKAKMDALKDEGERVLNDAVAKILKKYSGLLYTIEEEEKKLNDIVNSKK